VVAVGGGVTGVLLSDSPCFLPFVVFVFLSFESLFGAVAVGMTSVSSSDSESTGSGLTGGLSLRPPTIGRGVVPSILPFLLFASFAFSFFDSGGKAAVDVTEVSSSDSLDMGLAAAVSP
jgi:hypothetical protein